MTSSKLTQFSIDLLLNSITLGGRASTFELGLEDSGKNVVCCLEERVHKENGIL